MGWGSVASVASNSATPWTAACQAPLSLEFSREEYWSGLPGCHALLRGSSQPRDQTHVFYISCIGGKFFPTNATWEDFFLM